MPRLTSPQRRVVTGDLAVLTLLTIAGFATHLTLADLGRLVVTLIGSLLAWVLIAPFFGVYRAEVMADPGSLWRVGWAAAVAAPMATFLRAVALNRDIPWVFVLVTMVTSAFALLLWRIIFGWWSVRQSTAEVRSATRPR